MLHWSQGLFGFVTHLDPLLKCFAPHVSAPVADSSTTPPRTPPAFDGDLDIVSLQRSYSEGLLPVTVLETVLERIEQYLKLDPAVWIYRETKEKVLDRARDLQDKYTGPSQYPPLFGVPFSVKDSIDVAGIPTTTSCSALSHVPSQTSPSVSVLLSLGAIFVGKTNLDSLATGLTGCRSPYGYPRSVFNSAYISGGSSSGSCVSVGANLVSFSVATDTAGSGRVPAGFNGVVGYKPTKGLISTTGVTPACLSLDCIAIIAQSVSDAQTIWDLTVSFDPEDRYAKVTSPMAQPFVNSIGPQAEAFKFGVPPPEALQICSQIYQRRFKAAVETLQRLGGRLQPIEWTPFEKAGKLLYEGSFVSERLASLPDNFLKDNRSSLHPVIAEIFSTVEARICTAADVFRDLHAKALYTRQAEKVFEYSATGVDVLVVPTAPMHWTIDEVEEDPIKRNSVLGEFTHFGNVLDLCGINVPAGTYMLEEAGQTGEREAGGKTLPFGVTFLGGSQRDTRVLDIAGRFDREMRAIDR